MKKKNTNLNGYVQIKKKKIEICNPLYKKKKKDFDLNILFSTR